MKVLLINYEYPPVGGGGGVAMSQLVGELGEIHELLVLTSRGRGMSRVQMEENTPVYRGWAPGCRHRTTVSMRSILSFLPASLWQGWRLVRQNHPDLINSWGAVPSGPTGVLLSQIFKIPHVLTMIGDDVYDPSRRSSPCRNAIVRWAMERSRWCTAWSNDVRDRARELLGRDVPIDVVPIGITPPQYRSANRFQLGMDRDAFYCISVGRLIRRKRYDLLLEKFAQSTDPKLKLLIIGEGPEERDLRQAIKTHNLAERVEMLGATENEKKFQYLANSNVYINVASHEGFGRTFLEAMACGLPVLAPPIGGQRDFLIHGKTGLTLEPDANDLMRRIDELMEDPEIAIEMGEFNRRHVQPYFMENIADIWAETYERYLKFLF